MLRRPRKLRRYIGDNLYNLLTQDNLKQTHQNQHADKVAAEDKQTHMGKVPYISLEEKLELHRRLKAYRFPLHCIEVVDCSTASNEDCEVTDMWIFAVILLVFGIIAIVTQQIEKSHRIIY
jgi:hypothetical protein